MKFIIIRIIDNKFQQVINEDTNIRWYASRIMTSIIQNKIYRVMAYTFIPTCGKPI